MKTGAYLRAAVIFLLAPLAGLVVGVFVTYSIWKGDISCIRGLNK